ncbi:uncharacterized protein LAESUDRAFT_636551, partial [Laetiporus sulphureus 93-53]
TFAIVTCCVATIVACIWSDIHPDVVYPTDSAWKARLLRSGFTMTALLTQELYVYQAALQWQAA